ncbi:MAG: MBL fold metallo-hydrolase [Desulfovibrionaceae bacterium]|nr:MBL fold metallo-hydrolase [Desulfovibrionaceae bacterium]
MQIYKLNRHLTAFYFWGDLEPANAALPVGVGSNWMFGTCQALGVACYVAHCGNDALLYDTLCTPEQALSVRNYLEAELNIKKIYVVLSHWHLDHVGGNAAFADCPIIATHKTREYLSLHKEGIEAGTLWGEPPINPLVLPHITLTAANSIFLNELEVQLLPFHIHSDDGLTLFIPQYGFLFPGDMLEDSATFIVSPEHIPQHLEELDWMRRLDIKKIYPNHGRSFIIEQGGYQPEFIDAVSHYLKSVCAILKKEPDATVPPLQEILADYFEQGIIHYWQPYENVHRNNVEQIRSAMKL